MKLFVGYGYNERDQWVEDWVFPLIRSFDFEVESGKGLEGLDLRDEVKRRIEKSRAAIGFATRRHEKVDGFWTTHRWVVNELTHADSRGLRSVEVRESGVEDQAGTRDGLGRVEFDFARKEALLVQLAAILQRWRRELQSVRVYLLPATLQSKINRIYRSPEFKCIYRSMIEAEESEPVEAKVIPDKGGFYIKLRDVPVNSSVQIEITHDGKTLRSFFEPIDAPGITLEGDV